MKTLFNGNFKATKNVDYMIDIMYGQKDWTMSSALREILANALDTKTEYSYSFKDGICTIKDSGTGLPKKAFVMGSSSKSSDGTCIGQFGEGLKMCLVTALRYGNNVSISTVGYGVETEKKHSNEYNTDLMRIIFNDNKRETGTEIRVECSEEEYRKALEMFIQFRPGYKQLEPALFLPGGFISILGLTTEERPNMLFSYDLKDKSLTNRDRNTVKSKQLKSEMEKTLQTMKSKESITLYLNGLKESPEAEEYKISFTPKSKKVWLEVIEKKYGKDVVFSSASDADIKAIYKGLTVIPCPTKQARDVLKSVGIKSSAMKTKAVKAEKVQIKQDDKIVYPIARNYVENWSVLDAGREILANALDVSNNKASITWCDGVCTIKDEGTGIERKHFVIGNSGKDQKDIGMFGEGFKMGSLVLARENREMLISTVGFNYRPALEDSEEFGTEIFCFKYEKNAVKKGTTITFKASEKETASIRNMFITFHTQTKIIVSSDTVDVLDGEPGHIYVNGLQAESIKSLYSYNIKDKTLVDSRDRNHVDDGKLSNVLTGFYNKLTDAAVIDKILTGWEGNQFLKEYSLILEPETPFFWYSEVDKCFPDTCISSMSDWKANFVASQAGYKLLKNVPPYIMQVISNNLKTADEVASMFQDKGILLGNEIIYPITENYISDWKEEDALVELVSNALDTGTDADIFCKNDVIFVTDQGKGLKKENFLFGESTSKSVGTAVGQFGEGLKLACLCFARNNHPVTIETVGFTAVATMRKDTIFNANVLSIVVNPKERSSGTIISIPGKQSLVDAAKKRFLAFEKDKTEIVDNIYSLKENAIYVNGVKIMETNAMYSYDLQGAYNKRNLNRDRKSFMNTQTAEGAVFSLILDVADEKFIENFIKNLKDAYFESNVVIHSLYMMTSKSKKLWKKIALKLYPESALSSGDEESDLLAIDNGIHILKNLPYTVFSLFQAIGFPCAKEAMKKKKQSEIVTVPRSKLGEKELKRYDFMMSVAMSEYPDDYKRIHIAQSLHDTEDGKIVQGLFNSLTGNVYLLRGLLDSNRYTKDADILGVLDHEMCHMKTGANDRTREFENGLTYRIGVLLEEKYSKN